MLCGVQNIDSRRLVAKILRNKWFRDTEWIRQRECGIGAGLLWIGTHSHIVSFPRPRSRLFVTRLRYFSVDGCGKVKRLKAR